MNGRLVGLRAGYGLVITLLLASSSCSWSRFSDVQKNAPNVVLEKPGNLPAGFGTGVASASVVVLDKNGKPVLTNGKPVLKGVRLIVTGSPGRWGGAVYNLGSSDQPNLDAVDSGHCAKRLCKLAKQPAGLPVASALDGEHQLCFVTGLAKDGLAIRCDDKFDYQLGVPGEVAGNIVSKAFNPKLSLDPPVLVLATDGAQRPVLVAGARFDDGQTEVERAWFYPPGVYAAKDVQLLTPPGSSLDPGYASAVAVARLDNAKDNDTRIIAVGAPAPGSGHVWLFRWDKGATTATPVGCLGGPPGFGRTLASGIVDHDLDEDLVVADDKNISVFSGKALGELTSTTSTQCSLASLPPAALIASFGCGATPAISGCSTSHFGASIAVGDLDGNGDGEVIVGAPFMTVRGISEAGALLVYDVSSKHPGVLTDVDFISSAESGDHLGTSVTTVRIGGNRDIIAAGAPGHDKVALFYCSKLLPERLRGARCQ